jgi:hypothetical protein
MRNPLVVAMMPSHPIVKFTMDRIRERVEIQKQGIDDGKRDFLTRCFEAQKKHSDLVTDDMIHVYNIDNILAGSDTTGISLRAVSQPIVISGLVCGI